MNTRRVALLLCAIGVVQLVFIFRLLHQKTSAPFTAGSSSTQPAAAKIQVAERTVTNRFDWRAVESSDYRAYIANLRAVGCPEETVRDIIIADIEKMLAARVKAAAEAKTGHRHFWEPETDEVTDLFAAEKFKQEQALESQKRALVQELLGIDLKLEKKKIGTEENLVDRRLEFLPPNKRTQVAEVLERFSQREFQMQQAMADNGGRRSPEDRVRIKELRNERDLELASLLSPEEKQLYDYWTSNTGVSTRHALGALEKPTEQDFVTIYNLRKQYEDQFNPENADARDPNLQANEKQASEALEQNIRAQLGEDRYAEYKRGQDMQFRALADLTQHFHLPRETAAKLYELKRSIDEQATRLAADENRPDDQRVAQTITLRKEAGKTVRQLLGDEAFKYYRRNGEAGWFEAE